MCGIKILVPEECNEDEDLDLVFSSYHCWVDLSDHGTTCERKKCTCCEEMEIPREELVKYVDNDAIDELVKILGIVVV